MTTEAFGSVPHGSPPATTAGGRGASSYGGQSDPDELLEGLKRIRRKKVAAVLILRAKKENRVPLRI